MERTSAIPFEMKQLAAEGKFVGYASYYGNVDLQDDVVQPYAFREWLKENNGRGVPILNAHKMDQVVGYSVSLQEDRTGLLVEGELTINSTLGRDAYETLKHAVRVGHEPGLSIGYTGRGSNAFTYDGNVRKLHNLNLLEFSLACVPANPLARVTGVKMDDQTLYEMLRERVKSVDDLHKLLKDADVLTRRERGRFMSDLSAEIPAGESLRTQMRKAFKATAKREAEMRRLVARHAIGVGAEAEKRVPKHPYERTVSVTERRKAWEEECREVQKKRDDYIAHGPSIPVNNRSAAEAYFSMPEPPPDEPVVELDYQAWQANYDREYAKLFEELMDRVKQCNEWDDLAELFDDFEDWREWDVDELKQLFGS